ncbi:MAG: acetyl-CoA carboxylase biotin carboxyl carrier protein subunit [Thermoanaerobaculia bacterium]
MVFVYRGEDGPEEIVVERRGCECRLTRGGQTERADIARLPDGRLSLLFESGRQVSGRVCGAPFGAVTVASRGVTRLLEIAEPLRDRLTHAPEAGPAGGQEEQIRALIPGRVADVAVGVGDSVAPGGLLLVLEAMKMQNEIRSARGGTVVELCVARGQAVEGGALLATLRS